MIRKAEIKDIDSIVQIAQKSWEVTYKEILSPEQQEYMIRRSYSKDVIEKLILENKQIFLIFSQEGKDLGFTAYEIGYPEALYCRIHKLYLLPESKGSGIGKILISELKNIAAQNNCKALHLNVNKFNPAVGFYKKVGFTLLREEVLQIGNGFVMDDFVLVLEV